MSGKFATLCHLVITYRASKKFRNTLEIENLAALGLMHGVAVGIRDGCAPGNTSRLEDVINRI